MIELIVGALPVLLLLLKQWFAWRERRRKAAARGDIEGMAIAISEGDTDAVEEALYGLDVLHET